jgi:hypothetical protein
VFLFGEHIRTGVVELAGEALALAIIVAGAWTISHSCLILGADGYAPCLPDRYQVPAQRTQLGELDYQAAGESGGGTRDGNQQRADQALTLQGRVGTRIAERAGQPPLP